MKLSIAMMVKNEEKHLQECLESLQVFRLGMQSELIIVDTGSTDNTVDIAKQYTDKVYFHQWNDDFSAMRNITIEYCTGEWIFIIDGDEVLENGGAIVEFLQSKKSSIYNSAMVTVKNFLSSTDKNNTAVLSSPRIFKNDGTFRYEGVVHNQPIYKGPVAQINSILLHYGYINDDRELMEKKFKRTSSLLIKELEKEPDNIYYLFQLSVSYNMHGDKKEALEPIEKALELLKNVKDKSVYIYAYLHAVKVYIQNCEYKKALQVSQEIYKIDSTCIDNYYYMGTCYMAEQQYEKAMESYEKHIKLVDNRQNDKGMSVTYYTLDKKNSELNDIARIYQIRGDSKKALQYLEKINHKDDIANYYGINLPIYLKNKKLDNIYDIYQYTKDEDMKKDGFLGILEGEISKLDSDFKKQVYRCFSKEHDDYGILSSLRYDPENFCEELLEGFDFAHKKPYFAEILYHMLKKHEDITQYLQCISEEDMNLYLTYMVVNYNSERGLMEDYLRSISTSDQLIHRIICKNIRSVLITDNYFYGEKFKEELKLYLENGKFVLENLYNNVVLQEENIHLLKSCEDQFMGYMRLAQQCKDMDNQKYISYLGKCLKTYPAMKNGIEILLEEFKKAEEEKQLQFIEDMNKVKDNIKSLIESGDVANGKVLLNEIESMGILDEDVFSMKSVISIMENNLFLARKILNDGLKKYKHSFDLNYNMAYVYENTKDIYSAIIYYMRALKYSSDSQNQEDITNYLKTMKSLGRNDMYSKRHKVVLCGSQKDILEFETEFLQYEVIAYVSKDEEEDNFLAGDAIEYNDIKTLNYDFIMITEDERRNEILVALHKEGITRDIYLYSNFRTSVIEGFNYKMKKLEQKESVQAIVTGLSYAEVGICEELMSMETINMALSAQDLYYDYEILEYILEHSAACKDVKYGIINLAYYSFDYDMTRTIAMYRIHRYMDYFCDYHHNEDKLGVHLARSSYENNITDDMYEKMSHTKSKTIMKENIVEQDYEAEKNATMDYPKTREENIEVFRRILDLLQLHNIKPIICILPVSHNYRKNFHDGKQKNKFYKILDKIGEEYKFAVVDYFESTLFQNEDFWDYSHLNGWGAAKFTKIINEKILE